MKDTSNYSKTVMYVTALDHLYVGQSTSREVQRQHILKVLRQGPKTSYDRRSLGDFHPRCARYHFRSEPVQGNVDA